MAGKQAPEGTVIQMQDGSMKIKRGGVWTTYQGADQSAPGAAYFGAPGGTAKIPQQEEILLKDARKASQSARGAASEAARFENLNKDVWTGGLDDIGVIGWATSLLNPKKSEMRAISEKMVPLQRDAGSGAMSDKDVEMYRAAVPAIDKPGPTNQAIASVTKAAARRQSDYVAFLDYYVNRNGSLRGAEEAWQAYADKNPLFGKGKTGTTVLATPGWRQWFGVGPVGGARPPSAPARPAAAPARPAAKPKRDPAKDPLGLFK
jgi:hypothetical protein